MNNRLIFASVAALGLAAFNVSASAQDYRQSDRERDVVRHDRSDYALITRDRISAELNQLDRMFAHVRNDVFGGGHSRIVRAEFAQLLGERDRLNQRLRGGFADPSRVHEHIERMRFQLRRLEERLEARDRGDRYYNWR